MNRIGLVLSGLCIAVLTMGMVLIVRTPRMDVAVTSSYLHAAVCDVLQARPENVACLAQPGSCPGHFDVRPAQARQIRDARVAFRFDFQSGLADRFDGTRMIPVVCDGGLCEPGAYLGVCRQVADGLCSAGLMNSPQADASLYRIEQRILRLSREQAVRIREAGLTHAPVACSSHQAAFCRTLGLDVVATLGGNDTLSIRSVQQAVDRMRQAHCRLVIANRPEGTQLAELLAQRCQAGLAVFDNLPLMDGTCDTFDQLYTGNVDRLLAARPKP